MLSKLYNQSLGEYGFKISETVFPEVKEVKGLSGLTGLDIKDNSVYNVTKKEVINDLDCTLDNEI